MFKILVAGYILIFVAIIWAGIDFHKMEERKSEAQKKIDDQCKRIMESVHRQFLKEQFSKMRKAIDELGVIIRSK